MMKLRSFIILASLVIGSFGMANGAAISLGNVDGLNATNGLQMGVPVTFFIRLQGDANNYGGITNGYRIYSPTGATWTTTVADTTVGAFSLMTWLFNHFIYHGGVTGSGSDTVGYGAYASPPGLGLPPNSMDPSIYDKEYFKIQIGPIPSTYNGGQICLDSSFYPPSGVWKWAGPDAFPSWDGPHCFTIGEEVDPCDPDLTAPVITCPGDITVECGGSTHPDVTGYATAVDFCDENPTIDWVDDQVGDVITRTWTATDDVGNSSSCDQTITLEDTTDPAFVEACPGDITVECDAVPAPPTLTAIDACDPAPVVTFDESIVGDVITRTWTATDASGNSTQCVQIITTTDTTPPEFDQACPTDESVECGGPLPPIPTLTATDNCDPAPVVTFDESTVGDVITRTWTATDNADNSVQCVQTITIVDTQDPTFTTVCPGDISIECDAQIPGPATMTADDACDPAPVVTFDESTVGNVITRTWTATDETGNFVECVQTITLLDSTAPEFVEECPADLVIECGGQVPDPATMTATDNCDPAPVVTFDQSTEGNIITRTWTATDNAANSTVCTQTITLAVDDEAPVFDQACPGDITVECDAVPAPPTMTATDNCDPSPVVTFDESIEGNIITRTWTATDASGNSAQCVQLITLIDTTAPEFVEACPADITVECDAVPDPATMTATDNCDPSPVVTFDETIADDIITRTWTATDASGNDVQCVQTITLIDTTDPTFVEACPADFTLQCGEEMPAPPTMTATDNCDPAPVVTFDEVVGVGVITRTWTATDNAGNSVDCIQTITLADDTEAPVITCPDPVTVTCGGSIHPDATGYATAVDNCDDSPTIDWIDDQVGDIITRTWTATDASSNSSSCDQIITLGVQDVPTITCPTEPVQVFLGLPGDTCVDLPITDATDVTVDGATWADDQLCFDVPQGGMYEFEVVASNECGSASCEITVLVVIPSDTWVLIHSPNPSLDGVPLSPGDLVTFYDLGTRGSTVLCGMTKVDPDGFLTATVYGNSPYTAWDEGPEDGEDVTVEIGGTPVSHSTPIIFNEGMVDPIDIMGDFTSATCVTYDLSAGWHLISWNVAYSDDIQNMVATFADKIDVILGFDLAQGGGLTFVPSLAEYSTLLEVDFYHGYWFRLNDDVSFDVCGGIISSDGIAIYGGWNLVSYWPESSQPIEDGFSSILGNVLIAYTFDGDYLVYDPADPGSSTLSDLSPGLGYWVLSSSGGFLSYGGGAPVAPREITMPLAAANGVTPSRSWMSIYGSGITVDGTELEAGAAVEVYTETGVLCGKGVYGDGLLKFTAVYGYENDGDIAQAYPRINDRLVVRIDGSEVDADIAFQGSGSCVSLSRLTTDGNTVPGSFSLSQNYPNPFNPTTSISFNLPTSGHVELTVFNILGQQVATLVNGSLTAGQHEATWNGSDDSGDAVGSGIYFYRLVASNVTETKKMVLMK